MSDRSKEMNAFPVILQEGLTHNSHVEVGLTLRQYYAGLAMQGMAANSVGFWGDIPEELAKKSVKCADALLEELSK